MTRDLDPRPGLLLTLAFVVLFFLPLELYYLAAYLLAALLSLGGRFGFKGILTPLKAIAPILVLTLVLTPFFIPHGELLFDLGGPLRWTAAGLREALRMILRFSGVTCGIYRYFAAVNADDFVLTLRWYGLPFKASLVITMAVRYIPLMMNLQAHVREAHRLRLPADPAGGSPSFSHRWRRLLPELTSVLIQAIKGIPHLAMALETKGFGRTRARSAYRTLPAGPRLFRDFWIAAATLALLLLPLILI